MKMRHCTRITRRRPAMAQTSSLGLKVEFINNTVIFVAETVAALLGNATL